MQSNTARRPVDSGGEMLASVVNGFEENHGTGATTAAYPLVFNGMRGQLDERATEIRESAKARTTMFHLFFFFAGIAFYFLPTIIAHNRHACGSTGILLLNLFLGWTFIGWIVALIWAVSSMPRYYFRPYW